LGGARFLKNEKNIFYAFLKKLVDWKNGFIDAVCRRETEIEKAKGKRILAVVILASVVVLLVLFYVFVGRRIALLLKDPQAFREWLNGLGGWHVALFILLRMAQTAFKVIPGEALELAAGSVFGTWGGLLWCLVGSLLGTVVILFLGRRYGVKMVGLFVSPKNLKLTKIFKNGRGMDGTIFLLYFVPGLPKDVFSWLFSLTDEKPYKFLFLTTIARIPSIITSTYCGGALVKGDYRSFSVVFGATAILSAVCGGIYAAKRKRRREEDKEKV
jgi:uncharacterized membrane protein YdjX (TVP38/TMEM64 family)